MSDLTPEQLEKVVQQHVDALSEFFDAVQVLCSHTMKEGTGSVFTGSGNWFARQGMAHQFIKSDDAETLAHKMPKPPPDDGEEWRG